MYHRAATPNRGIDPRIAWSPDGEFLAYTVVSTTGAATELWVARPLPGTVTDFPRRITEAPPAFRELDWGPN